MKRILAAGFIAAIAMAGFSSTASAAPAGAACFGQVHKTVNSGGVPGFDNVGQARPGPRRRPGEEHDRQLAVLVLKLVPA